MVELTEKELQKERTAADFLPWVEAVLEELGSTKEGRTAVRSGHGLAKPLVEEALPLAIFALHHFGSSQDVDVQLVLGNQNHDAVINDHRAAPSPFSYVEVTQAHAGEDEHLRMLALEEKGHVNVLGGVTKRGTKATGIKVEVEDVALRHDVVLERELGLVEAAILRKAQKEYREGTALLVVFEDHIAIKDDSDVEALRSRVVCLLPKVGRFTWLGVVGWSKTTFLEFDLR